MNELVFEELTDGPTDYLEAWDRQREVHAEVVAGGPDTVLLLEHSPVYTAGKRTEPHERPTDGTPVIEVDRGGKITFHGPGQLVGYPIVRLPDHVLVVDYVRRLEEALIARLRRPRRHHRPGARPQRRLAAGRRPAVRSARSPRSASGSAAA